MRIRILVAFAVWLKSISEVANEVDEKDSPSTDSLPYKTVFNMVISWVT